MKKPLVFLLIPFLFLTSCSREEEPQPSNSSDSSNNSSSQVKVSIEMEETTSFTTDRRFIGGVNGTIAGDLYIPNNSQEIYPLIIISHGFGGNRSSTRGVAEKMAKAGAAAFIFDFCGGGQGSESDGDMQHMSVLTEARDLDAVVDYLKEDERFDPDNIFLLGQSQGGFVSTYVAATRDDIKGLLPFYPAYCIRDDAEKEYASADLVPETYSVLGFATVGKIYYVDAVSFDIYELMEQYENNVLLFHGTNDTVVPYEYSVRASQTFPHCEFITYQGAGHGFSGNDDTDSINRSIQFLKDNLD